GLSHSVMVIGALRSERYRYQTSPLVADWPQFAAPSFVDRSVEPSTATPSTSQIAFSTSSFDGGAPQSGPTIVSRPEPCSAKRPPPRIRYDCPIVAANVVEDWCEPAPQFALLSLQANAALPGQASPA